MKILVVGATGTLGRQVARYALEQGYQVRCLVRNPKRATFLKEWGAQLVKGDLCKPETLPTALEGVEAVIDAATARATDSLSIKQVDWQGKLNLIEAAIASGIERYIFFSILNADKYRNVPLMDIKYCTEKLLSETDLNYTILKLGGFMQGLISQYAIPILDNQIVWVTGESTPIAYMNTEDIAKFAIAALKKPATERQTYPVVGPKAWGAYEIIDLCERKAGQKAKISRIPLGLLRGMRTVTRFFQWGQNTSQRLAFAEVLASGKPLDADMSEVYQVFGLDPQQISTLEAYLDEYFSRILTKLRELGYQKQKQKTPFKSKS